MDFILNYYYLHLNIKAPIIAHSLKNKHSMVHKKIVLNTITDRPNGSKKIF